MPEKCIFTNISDHTKDNEMKVVGGWEFELESENWQRLLMLTGVALTSIGVVRWSRVTVTPYSNLNRLLVP